MKNATQTSARACQRRGSGIIVSVTMRLLGRSAGIYSRAAFEAEDRCVLLDLPRLGRALQEAGEVRATRIGEEHLVAESREEVEQQVGVPPLVEDVGSEHEVPRRAVELASRVEPRRHGRLEPGPVPLGVRPEQ